MNIKKTMAAIADLEKPKSGANKISNPKARNKHQSIIFTNLLCLVLIIKIQQKKSGVN